MIKNTYIFASTVTVKTDFSIYENAYDFNYFVYYTENGKTTFRHAKDLKDAILFDRFNFKGIEVIYTTL